MNFVMGFIFTVMEDEELSFRSFIQLIDRNLVSNNIYFIYIYIYIYYSYTERYINTGFKEY